MSIPSRREIKQKQRTFNWRLFFAIVLAVFGIALIFADTIRNYVLVWQVSQQTQVAKTISAEEIKANEGIEASFKFEDINAISVESVTQAALNKSKVPAIGLVAVPSVNINLTIAKGVTDLNMLVGAGTLRADQQMGQGNYPIASHHVISPGGENLLFSPLPKVKMGEKIYLTDMENVYEYTIYMNEIVHETRVDLVYDTPGDNIVTLITCDEDGGEERYVIRGRLEKVVPLDQATSEMTQAFGLESKTL